MKVKLFNNSIERFIKDLDPVTVAKVLRTIDLLEQFGSSLGMPHSKKIAPQLFELRIRGKQEIRIIYTFYNGSIILLHGFLKKSQRIPLSDLRAAENRLRSLDKI